MQLAGANHLFERALDAHDALVDLTAVGFDLGLAGPADGAEPAALALEMGPAPDQPRTLIGEMGELDLEAALAGACALAEDLQDQAGAVDHLATPGALEVALLDRAERHIHADQPDLVVADALAEILDRAGAEIGRGPRPRHRHDVPDHDVEIDRARETDSLFKT